MSVAILHKAGLHLILAHSPEEKVAHATKALELYRALYDESDHPTKEQKESQETLIENAESLLKQAEELEVEYGVDEEDGELSESEIQTRVDEYCERIDEEEAAADARGKGDVMEGGDEDATEDAPPSSSSAPFVSGATEGVKITE